MMLVTIGSFTYLKYSLGQLWKPHFPLSMQVLLRLLVTQVNTRDLLPFPPHDAEHANHSLHEDVIARLPLMEVEGLLKTIVKSFKTIAVVILRLRCKGYVCP